MSVAVEDMAVAPGESRVTCNLPRKDYLALNNGHDRLILSSSSDAEQSLISDHHRERGVKWRRYSEMFPGILPFVLFQTQVFGFSLTDWFLLKNIDFDSLHRHLDTKQISALCSGKKFEASLNLTGDDEFVGECIPLDKSRPWRLGAFLAVIYSSRPATLVYCYIPHTAPYRTLLVHLAPWPLLSSTRMNIRTELAETEVLA
jgi:hypothetical protein